jgi:hypothetical protein
MFEDHNTAGALALLLSLDVKFVNTSQKSTDYFSTLKDFFVSSNVYDRLSSRHRTRRDLRSITRKLRYSTFTVHLARYIAVSSASVRT